MTTADVLMLAVSLLESVSMQHSQDIAAGPLQVQVLFSIHIERAAFPGGAAS